jgi:excisionase family DNA binding protein
MSSNIEVQRICEYCGKEFTARTTKTRYCSHICNSRAYKDNVKDLKVELSYQESRQILSQFIGELYAKPFLNINESCRLLGISRRSIYRLLKSGKLKAGKVGKRTIITRIEIDRLFI